MLPVFVTSRTGEFRLFHQWWNEGFRFGLITIPHKRPDPAVSLNHARAFAGFPGRKYLDNGIFQGVRMSIEELFHYASTVVKADFVFIPDVFGDANATLARAEDALKVLPRWGNGVKPVAIAQGQNADEYMYCARELLGMGYTHLAVGGLLREVPGGEEVTAGPLRKIDEPLMWEVLRRVRNELDPPWLHVLGALHHERVARFEALGVTSADSKQWARGYTHLPAYKHGLAGRMRLLDAYVRQFYFARQGVLPLS